MRASLCAVVLLLVTMGASAQPIPPVGLQAELLNGGQVALTWSPPPEGLFEDFEDGVADDFDSYPGNIWTVEDGYLKCSSWTDWKSAWYTGLEFTDFTLEGIFVNHASTNSRGLIFRASGPQAVGGNGYSFYVAYNIVNYAVYRYTNGSLTLVHNWTESGLIHTGVGETNILKVVGTGSTFDLYINNTYASSFTDATYPGGMVGAVASSQVVAWYDQISCLYTGAGERRDRVFDPEPGVACNEYGVPLHGWTPPLETAVEVSPAPRQSNARELDEFVEYRIYRDGGLVGTSTTESYMDHLPSLGEHLYEVTAYYEPEGESVPAGPVTVNWVAVTLDLVGQITVIPPGGGNLFYDATVVNTLQQTFNNVDYWTSIRLPNQQLFGPLTMVTVNIPGFADITVTALSQHIPALAPPGEYTFTGYLGHFPNMQLSDGFPFTKQSPGADGIEFDPDDWAAGGTFTLAGEGSGVGQVPSEFSLSEACPNPFNPDASFVVSLPEASRLTVAVYNIIGRRVATLADGWASAGEHRLTFDAAGEASGLYFIQAVVPGRMNQIRKATLLQ